MVNESGKISYNNEPDINITFPADFKASLTVNHIYPTNIPERPAFAEDLQRVLSKHKNYDLTPITDWVVKIIDDVDLEEIVRKSTYGKLQIYTDNPKLSKYKGVKVVDSRMTLWVLSSVMPIVVGAVFMFLGGVSAYFTLYLSAFIYKMGWLLYLVIFDQGFLAFFIILKLYKIIHSGHFFLPLFFSPFYPKNLYS